METEIDETEDVEAGLVAPPFPVLPPELASLSPAELAAKEREWRGALIKTARKDFNAFAELVATDDDTGEPLHQEDIHHKWAALADKYKRLLIWSHAESGKTTQLSVLRTVWELGRDTTLRFVILSNTAGIASKIVRSIENYIKSNDRVKEIFPNLVPHPDGPWTTTECTVVRTSNAKDPSVRAVGVSGSLTSGRVDRLIVDDILDPENTETESVRKKLDTWFKSVALSRLTARARVLIVGTAWHPKDLLHTMAKNRAYKWFRFPIVSDDGKSTWDARWPADRITEKRIELGPAEFARTMLCKARDDDESRFKQEWIDAALLKGRDLNFVQSLAEIEGNEPAEGEDPLGTVPEGCVTFVGVDLSTGKKSAGRKKETDDTVFFTFLQYPNGERRILNIELGKFDAPTIVRKCEEHNARYKPIMLVVENNGSQDFILQFARVDSNMPIVPFTTTKKKRDHIFGVEGIAIDLFNGKWIFPSGHGASLPHKNLERFIREMLFFSPDSHTGDVLMAAYFAREKARELAAGHGESPTVGVTIVGAAARTDESGTEIGELEALFTVPGAKVVN